MDGMVDYSEIKLLVYECVMLDAERGSVCSYLFFFSFISSSVVG